MRCPSALASISQVAAIWVASSLFTPARAQESELHDLEVSYEIEIVTADLDLPIRTTHGVIDGKSASREALANYEKLFCREFRVYPSSLVRAALLKRIVLCEALSFAEQQRNAIPDFERGVLYLDVKRGDHSQQYQRKVIHHEFFHLIDFQDDGNVYADAAWSTLNTKTFRYGNGGRNAQENAETSVLTDLYPGFLNHYSTTGVEEDKAEMFANLIVVPTRVEKLATSDPVIRSKVVSMKRLLEEFCPDMSDAFWERVTGAQRSPK